jgi:hypothetical protein
MIKQAPYGQYAVYSYENYRAMFPNAVPSARYDDIEHAKHHAESVTYKMVVVDMKAESRGLIYVNDDATAPTPKNSRPPFPGHCLVG